MHQLGSNGRSREGRQESRVIPCRSLSPSFALEDLIGPEPHVAPPAVAAQPHSEDGSCLLLSCMVGEAGVIG